MCSQKSNDTSLLLAHSLYDSKSVVCAQLQHHLIMRSSSTWVILHHHQHIYLQHYLYSSHPSEYVLLSTARKPRKYFSSTVKTLFLPFSKNNKDKYRLWIEPGKAIYLYIASSMITQVNLKLFPWKIPKNSSPSSYLDKIDVYLRWKDNV